MVIPIEAASLEVTHVVKEDLNVDVDQ